MEPEQFNLLMENQLSAGHEKLINEAINAIVAGETEYVDHAAKEREISIGVMLRIAGIEYMKEARA